MAIDKSQFFQVYFEETGENLAELERLLLGLNIDAPAQEDLNAIFRAVHSIKGASGTFGFNNLVNVAHIFESLLDKIRIGEIPFRVEMVDQFLKAGDVLKAQLEGHKKGVQTDSAEAAEVCESLTEFAKEAETAGSIRETVQTISALSGEIKPEEDPGYGFFDDLDPVERDTEAKPALDKGREKRDVSNRGRRKTDLAPDSDLPMRAGQRSDDRMVVSDKSASSSIRVGIEKVDQLINQVGELVITQSMLAQTASQIDYAAYEKLQNGLIQLERNTRTLQESVMAIRMVPISLMFSRFSRLVRDIAAKMNKQVSLKINGGETEVDKSMIEKLIDPMTHLVRNSLDHGIETPAQRASAGKDPIGVITLSAYHQGGKIIIEVSDDGAGLNREKIMEKAREKRIAFDETISDQELWQFIFLPGFSTAEKVTEVSGRGVGMDVVKRNVHGVGGRIEIRSEPGRGSKFIIQLPLTLSIIEGMTLRIGKEIYIIPLISIVESVRPKKSDVKTIAGKGEVLDVRGTYIPIVRLYRQFKVLPDLTDPCQAVLVIVEAEGRRIAMMVDELVGQQQVVIKSLQDNYKKVEGFSGATILGDGQVAFILDVLGLIGTTKKEEELFSEVKN